MNDMKKETVTEQYKIAEAFKNEIAVRYDLPELRNAVMKQDEDCTALWRAESDVQPSGQLAGIVCTLHAKVTVTFSDDSKSVHGLSSGSNGAKQDFIIVLEYKYGDIHYAGYLSWQLYYQAQQQRELIA